MNGIAKEANGYQTCDKDVRRANNLSEGKILRLDFVVAAQFSFKLIAVIDEEQLIFQLLLAFLVIMERHFNHINTTKLSRNYAVSSQLCLHSSRIVFF